ncbi:helix-turn-helix transcriptional regulator [Roseospira navarrensis]|uniref:PAS domain-containing protein n=1 Tax=Roseospira navarrensis TaxID=140058 RepID=A0A7X1ZB86_9PROT|nr:helix-turn-helix transcriptional regulator [Roseospira navarrensis]MQX35336.1 PAS domain-containing protein [Roseospira navarrensis]
MNETLIGPDSGRGAPSGQYDVRYLALTTLLPWVVWETDQNGRFRFVSSLVLELFGRHPQELIGEPFDSVFEDRSWTLNAQLRPAGQVPTADGTWGSMFLARTYRGKPLFGRVEGRRCFDPASGQFIGTIGIAEFVPQDSMRQSAAAALAEVLARGMLGVCLVDEQGTITFANSVFRRAVGSPDTEMVGDRLSQHLQIPAPCSPSERGAGVWQDMRAVKQDGQGRPLAAVFGALQGPRNQQLVIVIDESARRLAGSLLRDAGRADALLTRYAEVLMSGFHDLSPVVLSALDAWSQTGAGQTDAEPVADEVLKDLRGSTLATLTQRQTQVLELLASGKTNKEIGRTLGISEATVKTHVRSLKDALGAGNRTSTAAIAARLFPTGP